MLVGNGASSLPTWAEKAPKATDADNASKVSVMGLATNGTVAYYLTGVQTHSTSADNRSLISTKNVTITGAGSVSMVNLNATGIVTLSGVTTVAGIVKISSAGKLSAGAIDLANEVSGTLPVGNLPTGTGSTQVALGDQGWYRIATLQNRSSANGVFRVSDQTGGNEVLFTASVGAGSYGSLTQLGCSGVTNISKARIAYSGAYAFLEVYNNTATAKVISVEAVEGLPN